MARRHLAVSSLGVAVVALLIAARAGCQTSQAAALDANPRATHRTEQEAIVADFAARGINSSPPAAWIDPAL